MNEKQAWEEWIQADVASEKADAKFHELMRQAISSFPNDSNEVERPLRASNDPDFREELELAETDKREKQRLADLAFDKWKVLRWGA